jgi:hypothetical protein
LFRSSVWSARRERERGRVIGVVRGSPSFREQANYLLTLLDELDDMEQEAHDLLVMISRVLHRPLDAAVPEYIATPRRPARPGRV